MGGATVALATALVLGWAVADSVPSCEFEGRLRVAEGTVREGQRAKFSLAVRNTTTTALRLIDTRGGRRRDLGDTYYLLEVRTHAGKEPSILTAISDPGPIEGADIFTLEPGKVVTIPITSPLALETLPRGSYKAHVVITVDPYGSWSRCKSDAVAFEIR